ncbi:thioredoxin [Acidobacteria bacterium AH-259-O06]|nr:thioredoxin [Acidobacteria bacterium AH-259-O06]
MANETKSITLTVENFQSEVLESTQPVVVDFWASWCGPCHMIAPVIEELAVDFEGRAKVGKLDIDEHASIAMQFAIRSIPTLLFFEDGQVVDQVFGVAPKKVLSDKLNRLLSEGRFRAEEAMLDD